MSSFQPIRLLPFRVGRRSNARRLLLYILLFLGFLICWCLLTFLILLAQDTLLGTDEDAARLNAKRDTNLNRGIQIVVGHYSGNLPAERMANLTQGNMSLIFYKYICRRNKYEQLQSDRTLW